MHLESTLMAKALPARFCHQRVQYALIRLLWMASCSKTSDHEAVRRSLQLIDGQADRVTTEPRRQRFTKGDATA